MQGTNANPAEIATDSLEQTAETLRETLNSNNEQGRINITNGRSTATINAGHDVEIEYNEGKNQILLKIGGFVRATVREDSRVWGIGGIEVSESDTNNETGETGTSIEEIASKAATAEANEEWKRASALYNHLSDMAEQKNKGCKSEENPMASLPTDVDNCFGCKARVPTDLVSKKRIDGKDRTVCIYCQSRNDL